MGDELMAWKPGEHWRSPIAVNPRSGNTKTGPVATTSVSQLTCPPCPLLGNGCYAEDIGMQPMTTRRLNSNAETNRTKVAKLEAHAIDLLKGDRDLRVHVVGDCATVTAARIVGAAMRRYERRSGYKAWTYTHAWQMVPASAWQGARVAASVHSADDVSKARSQGYTMIAMVRSREDGQHPTHKRYRYEGLDVVPCPAQVKDSGVHCYDHASKSRSCDICKAHSGAVVFQDDHLPKLAIKA